MWERADADSQVIRVDNKDHNYLVTRNYENIIKRMRQRRWWKKKQKICSLGPPSHRDQTLDQPPPDSSQSLMTFILIFYLSFSYALDIRFPMIVLHLSALAASLWVRSNLRLDNLVPSSKSISCLPIQIFITKCGAIKKPGSSMFSVFFYCLQVLVKNANCLWTWDTIIGIVAQETQINAARQSSLTFLLHFMSTFLSLS